MAMKVCGNCKHCTRHGSGVKGYHYVCDKHGIVVSGHAERCEHFVYDRQKYRQDKKI